MNENTEKQQHKMLIFTRTPLHVGAGASVGAIDQPVQRERHTGFPIIPASSLKGAFADTWGNGQTLKEQNGKLVRVKTRKEDNEEKLEAVSDAAWLFGSDNDKFSWAGAVQLSEAKLLAFPIRSAKGAFAWITSPLILRRAARDGVLDSAHTDIDLADDSNAMFNAKGLLAHDDSIVLEDYRLKHAGDLPDDLALSFKTLFTDDPVWRDVDSRLVILSDGMMSFFAQNACEVAQHVRIDDETGTAVPGALFNQENVPSETMFYSVVNFFKERRAEQNQELRDASDAANEFSNKIGEHKTFQFGGDATTGLGLCSVRMAEKDETSANS